MLYDVISGYLDNPVIKNELLAKIHELETQQAAKDSAGGVAV